MSTRAAIERVLHMLLELRRRLSIVGLAVENSFELLLTRKELGQLDFYKASEKMDRARPPTIVTR